MMALAVLMAALSLLVIPMPSAFSCTRAVYFGQEGQTVTGRSMDWLEGMQLNLYAFPRGMARDGGLGDKSFWRTVADQKNKVYYFEDTASPSLVWIRLNQIDFQPGSGVRQVTLHGHPGLGGDQTTNFKKAEAFKFLAPH